MEENCTIETKVTFLKCKGWGVRIFLNGKLVDEDIVDSRTKIGPSIRSMLRMLDKCGWINKMAYNSRMRPGRKQAKEINI